MRINRQIKSFVVVSVAIVALLSIIGTYTYFGEEEVSEMEVGYINEDGERVPFEDGKGEVYSVFEGGELSSMWKSSDMEEKIDGVYAKPKVKVEAQDIDSVEISGDVSVEGYWLDGSMDRSNIHSDSDEFSETISSDDFGDWVTLDSGEMTVSEDDALWETGYQNSVHWEYDLTAESGDAADSDMADATISFYYGEDEDPEITSFETDTSYDYLSVVLRD